MSFTILSMLLRRPKKVEAPQLMYSRCGCGCTCANNVRLFVHRQRTVPPICAPCLSGACKIGKIPCPYKTPARRPVLGLGAAIDISVMPKEIQTEAR
jgi:hypothetical protein